MTVGLGGARMGHKGTAPGVYGVMGLLYALTVVVTAWVKGHGTRHTKKKSQSYSMII